MLSPKYLYELLLDQVSSQARVDQLMIGLVWTVCQSQEQLGLAMSPGVATRTLPWSGQLQGKPLNELASWILSWDPYQASVGMAAINCVLNQRPLPNSLALEMPEQGGNLAVFEHFLPQLHEQNVVVIGHYPGIERYAEFMQLSVLEKQPQADDLPDSASEYLLPDADWVFLTASAIVNKSFPRLAELASNAKTVLMGPSLPWLPQWHEFGIDYLAGVEVIDAPALLHTIAQGGGVRIFQHGLRYRIAELTPNTSLDWLRQQIAECAAERLQLTQDMERWYALGNSSRFPGYAQLDQVTQRLSRLDSSFKPLWDAHGQAAM